MERIIVQTDDGSSSILIPEMNESYHSTHGALQEAKHVFILNGLQRFQKDDMRVFEVGFGTGLNALLSMKYAQDNDVAIKYVAIEAYPVDLELIKQLNYSSLIPDATDDVFLSMHNVKWNELHRIHSNFELKKVHQKLEDYSIEGGFYDLVFFDAFGPRAQAEMWSVDLLEKMYNGLKSNGALITYCAQGQFKRNLKSIGFQVESVPGPPGKREMTVAIKDVK